ncbi:MAG: PIG-L family deacetylase [Planctomycetota bacterium]
MTPKQFLRACAALALSLAAARAQQPEPEAGLVALHQARLDATTDGVVLNIAAHPDDESSRTNTMLRRKYGLRVVTAYSTYGDGGQNAIGKEIGPELAQLRVRETLAASGMMGFEVRWLGMQDFGFSKTLDETLEVWGRERLLAAMRAVVAEVDPDLVLTNHSIDRGHGHHRASFWAIEEVLKERAAKGLRVPALYRRCPREEADFTFDPSELDPVRGETYARIAHRAWTQHVTQGPWGAHNALRVGKDHWRLAFPAGVDAAAARDWQRWLPPTLPAPEGAAIALELGRLRGAASAAKDATAARMRARIEALQRMLLAQAGVMVETWLDADTVARGGEGKVYVVVHGADLVRDLAVRCGGRAAEPVAPSVQRSPFDMMPAVPAGAAAGDAPPEPPPPPSPPEPELPGRLVVTFAHAASDGDLHERGPEPAWVELDVHFTLDGVPIELHPRLPYSPVDPIEVRWDRDVVMVPKGQAVQRILSATVVSHRDADLDEPIRLAMGLGVGAEAIPGRVSLSQEHPEARLLVRATFAKDELPEQPTLRMEIHGQKAPLRVVPVEVFVPPGLKVGLVRGPDDTIERALGDLGVAYSLLDRDALATARLEEFTTLLLDMRAYHHVPELAEHRDRILQFCRAGGRVVSMYHKPGEWNERQGQPLLAPFPLKIGNDRVTEEDAPVTLLQPQHRIWTQPHAITAADFDGWVQERGIYFSSQWDPAWTPLLEMKDSGDEKASQGALLYTQYGRGDFVYCSLVLYRQLRVGNAGAARILVNLLAR